MTFSLEDWRREERSYLPERRQEQQNILQEIIQIGKKPELPLHRIYNQLQHADSNSTLFQMLQLRIERALTSIHKAYSTFAMRIINQADGHLKFAENIRQVVEFNLQTLADMMQHPDSYHLAETTFEEVDVKGSFVGFQRLKVHKK